MTTTRTIKKQLAGEEDLLLGSGTEVQTRGGSDVTITKIHKVQPVDTVDILRQTDPNKYPTVQTLGFETKADGVALLYYWDATSTIAEDLPWVVASNVEATGRWRSAPLASGDVVPLIQASQAGNGVLTEFDTPATRAEPPESFSVYRDGVRQRPSVDYTTDTIGKLEFTSAPADGAQIDIVYLAPVHVYLAGIVLTAAEVSYDNTTSGFAATDVQAAIDEAATSGGGTSWIMSFAQTGELSSGDVWMADASSGNVTRNLPTAPSDDDEVMVRDYTDSAATNTITIGRNGENIEGLAEDMTISIVGGWVRLKYDTTNGWRIVQSS